MFKNTVCKDLKEFKQHIVMVSYSGVVSKPEYDRVVELTWSFLLELMQYCPEGAFLGEEKYFNSNISLCPDSTYPIMYYANRSLTFRVGPQNFIKLNQGGCELSYSDIRISIDDLYKIYSCSKKVLSYAKSIYRDYENSVAEKNALLCEDKKDASIYFEGLYHNTGKTLGEVLNIMKQEGYSYKETVGAICNVLQDAQWND